VATHRRSRYDVTALPSARWAADAGLRRSSDGVHQRVGDHEGGATIVTAARGPDRKEVDEPSPRQRRAHRSGEHASPDLIRTLVDCAQTCDLSRALILRASPLHQIY
jgi:hypothetical protein